VRLTANGRLFLRDRFALSGGADEIIVIDFGGVHLVETDSGAYVLTPQLQADVDVQTAEVEVTGEILSITPGTLSFVIDVEGEPFTILTDGETEFVDASENPIGFANLATGFIVEVRGVVDGSAMILADRVEIED
jgi:hypothetical protein